MTENKGARVHSQMKAQRINELREQGLTWRQIGKLLNLDSSSARKLWLRHQQKEIPGKLEYYKGKLSKVVDASRTGWWRFHEHYDRDGYCDNPARGY